MTRRDSEFRHRRSSHLSEPEWENTQCSKANRAVSCFTSLTYQTSRLVTSWVTIPSHASLCGWFQGEGGQEEAPSIKLSPLHAKSVCVCVSRVCVVGVFFFCLLLWQITWPVDLSQVCVYVSFNSIRKGFLNPKGKFSLNNSEVENNHRLQIAVLLKDTVARQKLGMLTNNQSSIN